MINIPIMGFGTKVFYLFFINLTITIKIASSVDDIIRYALIVVQNTTISIITLRLELEAVNETDCSSFKVPKIEGFCEVGLSMKDFSVDVTVQVLRTRAADCFENFKEINHAALFLVEGQKQMILLL